MFDSSIVVPGRALKVGDAVSGRIRKILEKFESIVLAEITAMSYSNYIEKR